jgi:hypothetical protein
MSIAFVVALNVSGQSQESNVPAAFNYILPHSFQASASLPCYAGTVQDEALWFDACNSHRTALYVLIHS